MSVRNSAKAILLHDGKILVNRCVSRFGEYYALPGGGQKSGETLIEAVKRELDARGIAIPYPQLDVHFDPQKRNT